MKTNFSLLFYLKKPKNYQNGDVPIYLRITVNGERAETTTNRQCKPDRWNSISGRFKGTKEEVKSFNAYLDNLQTQVYAAHGQLTEAGSIITAESLKNKLLGRSDKSRMLIDIFKQHNKRMAALIGNGYASGTVTCFETTLKHTQGLLVRKYQLSDIATTVTLSNGVPIETVSKMLGHTNIKTTQHYAKILDLKVGQD
jgi:hypothetical protein